MSLTQAFDLHLYSLAILDKAKATTSHLSFLITSSSHPSPIIILFPPTNPPSRRIFRAHETKNNINNNIYNKLGLASVFNYRSTRTRFNSMIMRPTSTTQNPAHWKNWTGYNLTFTPICNHSHTHIKKIST